MICAFVKLAGNRRQPVVRHPRRQILQRNRRSRPVCRIAKAALRSFANSIVYIPRSFAGSPISMLTLRTIASKCCILRWHIQRRRHHPEKHPAHPPAESRSTFHTCPSKLRPSHHRETPRLHFRNPAAFWRWALHDFDHAAHSVIGSIRSAAIDAGSIISATARPASPITRDNQRIQRRHILRIEIQRGRTTMAHSPPSESDSTSCVT